MSLIVDASVGMKWVLPEPDSDLAIALTLSGEVLLVPDFWLAEAASVLWQRVCRKTITPERARVGLLLLRDHVRPTPTHSLRLHDHALQIALVVNYSPYDTLYVAFALAMGATGVVVADAPFVRAMRSHPDPAINRMLIPLGEWRPQAP